MKYIIAGGRDYADYNTLERVAGKIIRPGDTVVSGGARGADALGERFAERHSLALEVYPAEWERYGKAAGYRRNHRMSLEADGLLAFWDGYSKGTKDMIQQAHKARLEIHIYYYEVSK